MTTTSYRDDLRYSTPSVVQATHDGYDSTSGALLEEA